MRKFNITKMSKRMIILVFALTILLSCTVTGTIAWLAAQSDPVENTFTHGDIIIDLDGGVFDNLELKMVPGNQIEEAATVTVKEKSEPCFLYLVVEKSNNFSSFMEYSLDGKWKKITDGILGDAQNASVNPNISIFYYEETTGTNKGTVVNALTAQQECTATITAKVLETVTKANLDAITTAPTLNITAYAIQSQHLNDAVAAWTSANYTAVPTSISATP